MLRLTYFQLNLVGGWQAVWLQVHLSFVLSGGYHRIMSREKDHQFEDKKFFLKLETYTPFVLARRTFNLGNSRR